MNPTSLKTIAEMADGTASNNFPDAVVNRVITDSRLAKNGDLFVALKGENFDGHSFISDVVRNGVTAVMSNRTFEMITPVIKVDDTLVGLQSLARFYRKTLACKIVGITGSNGKTSTKDFTATVLSSKYKVSKTKGNLNNHIGLPLSVLELDDAIDFAVLEMGMNHVGEIAPLAEISQPDFAVITNIGCAHIEHLKTKDAIAKEKGVLVQNLSATGTAILNANDDFTPSIARRSRGQVITAGIDAGEICATGLRTDSGGTRFKVKYSNETLDAFLPVPSQHMVGNAMLAVATGIAAGVPFELCVNALTNITPTKGRLEIKDFGGVFVIDDTYNANPDSTVAALKTLVSLPVLGKRIAVLGAMGELGEYTEEGHRSVGKETREIDVLVTVGDVAQWIAEEAENFGSIEVVRTADIAQACAVLSILIHKGDMVLIKGSRSAGMERIIQDLPALRPKG